MSKISLNISLFSFTLMVFLYLLICGQLMEMQTLLGKNYDTFLVNFHQKIAFRFKSFVIFHTRHLSIFQTVYDKCNLNISFPFLILLLLCRSCHGNIFNVYKSVNASFMCMTYNTSCVLIQSFLSSSIFFVFPIYQYGVHSQHNPQYSQENFPERFYLFCLHFP